MGTTVQKWLWRREEIPVDGGIYKDSFQLQKEPLGGSRGGKITSKGTLLCGAEYKIWKYLHKNTITSS